MTTFRRQLLFLFSAIILTSALYWPGLRGTFLFDDFPNIVSNHALQVTQSTPEAWLRAAWASPSSDLQRPIASLSFAINHYFSGLNPWPMKLTNLVIHLLNGLMLYRVLRGLLYLRAGDQSIESNSRDAWLSSLVASAWLLHPINLSAVLFVVQRMESLAQFFVLLGLLLYVQARQRQSDGSGRLGWRLWIGVPLCIALGVASKESAALLPLFALLLELTVLRHVPRPRYALKGFFLVFLILPGLLGIIWMLPRSITDAAYAHRAFSLVERLLTEPRVLLDYATWTLLPLPGFFSFYRDDYAISTSLMHPWSTLPSMLILGVALVFAWYQRSNRPLVSVGLLWFFAAHALTATVFPLELVFEHRNYFASIGLLLAAFDLLLPRQLVAPTALVRNAALVAFFALSVISLGLRAKTWADPVLFAVTEAAQHPFSPRATYDLGRMYVELSGYRTDSPNIARAISALEAAARVPRASILPEVGLLMVASNTGQPISDDWWESMTAKLRQRAPTPEDSSAIKSLTECQRRGRCVLNDRRMLELYTTASAHNPPNPAVLYSYAIFSHNQLHDRELALRLTRDAARSRDLQYQLNLVNFLIDLRQHSSAETELQVLRQRARPGSMDSDIARAEARLATIPKDGL